MQTQTSQNLYQLLEEGDPDAFVFHCSDPRFQEAFTMFMKDELGLRKPSKIVIPGSTSAFGAQMFFPKSWNAVRNWIELMVSRNKFPRIIIFMHDECKSYEALKKQFRQFSGVVEALQQKHLRELAEFVQKKYLPGASIELYRARIVERGNERLVVFEKIT